MSAPDLLAGAVAAKLRLLEDVQQLYPPRPDLAEPIRTVSALLHQLTDEDAVTITGSDPMVVEASIGIGDASSALTAGRTSIAEISATLPAGAPVLIRVRIAAIG